MRLQRLIGRLVCAVVAVAGVGPTTARAVLYSQDFDANDTANWAVNDNGFGTNAADFFFDYSTAGIPAAPNSAGASTLGLKLGANLSSATAPASGPFPGISVSPLGQGFTGDYEVKFDWWSNYLGPLGASPTTSDQLSTFGILTSGTVANYDGASDGLFFGATGNGGVPAGPDDGDYGAYSSERQSGYQLPVKVIRDGNALYVAGSRDNSAVTYTTFYPGGLAAPALQQTNFAATQSGVTPAGTMGFQWHEVEIEKLGSQVVWRVDGMVLIHVKTASFAVPTGVTNILLGHSDVNRTTSSSADFATLQFTLIDNVRVLTLQGDYDQDGNVDDEDYDVWKEHYGDADFPAADGNGDHIVDAADYTVWRNNLTPPDPGEEVIGEGGVSSSAVPEPTMIVLCGQLLGLALLAARRRTR